MKKWLTLIILVTTLTGLTACASAPTGQPAPASTQTLLPAPAVTEPPTPVEGTPLQTTQPTDIRNRPWKWVRTQMNDDSVQTPGKPDAFVITFGEDGQVTGSTDCNRFFGSYTLEDGLLSFGPLASTKMYCEGSQETAFLKSLAEVQSYLMVDHQLVLEIKYDSGQMIFE